MRVVFRADASTEIGTGHVMRCLTLADELARRGWKTEFLCLELEGNLISRINQQGHGVRVLPHPDKKRKPDPGAPRHAEWLPHSAMDDAEICSSYLQETHSGGVDWLVVDSYSLDAVWGLRMRGLTGKILCIDDLADRSQECDLLLDQNLRNDEGAGYDSLISSNAARLLGPRFALLRPEFKEARLKATASENSNMDILVFLGGADPDNHTEKVLCAVDFLNRSEISVNIVLGASNPNVAALHNKWCNRKNFHFHHDISNLGMVMAGCRMAIAGGGVSTWERLCVGLPTVAMAIAFNQEALLDSAAAKGLLLYAGRAKDTRQSDIAHLAARLLDEPETRVRMRHLGMQVVDGAGCERVASEMENRVENSQVR